MVFFLSKQDLTFHTNCIHRKCQNLFSWKNEKTISIFVLKSLPRVLSVPLLDGYCTSFFSNFETPKCTVWKLGQIW